MRLRRPVKWIEDRREHLIATNHSREQRHLAPRLPFDAEGRILGLEDEFFHDQGAYMRTHGARVMDRTLWSIPGPYRMPAYRGVGHFSLTNKTPAATYRAPGGYESTSCASASRCGRAQTWHRGRRNPSPQPHSASNEMPFRRTYEQPGVEPSVLDFGDYPAFSQGAGGRPVRCSERRPCTPTRRRRVRRRRA